MAVRPLVLVSVVIAGQLLAGCGMPAKDGVVGNSDNSHARRAERQVRDAQLRRQVEKGTFGIAQLFPGGDMVDARHFPPLPRPMAVVPVAVVPVPAPRANAAAALPPMQLASATAAGSAACVYKPVMSDADIEACR
jgi:hypothetical protein